MMQYESELLKTGEDFRANFAPNNPGHPELPLIDADIAARRAKIDQPSPVEPVVEAASTVTVISKYNLKDYLLKIAPVYRNDLYNPELVVDFQKAFWQVPRGGKRYTFRVPDLNWTQDEMSRPMKGVERISRRFREKLHPGMMVALPEEFRGKEGLVLLGKMWPEELGSSRVQEGTPVVDDYDFTGFVKVEASDESPNRDTKEADYAHLITPTVRGQRAVTYIVASEQNKVIGQYFDLNSWSRLPGSRVEGRVVVADFDSDGDVYVDWRWGRGGRDPGLGVRFEEHKA